MQEEFAQLIDAWFSLDLYSGDIYAEEKMEIKAQEFPKKNFFLSFFALFLYLVLCLWLWLQCTIWCQYASYMLECTRIRKF